MIGNRFQERGGRLVAGLGLAGLLFGAPHAWAQG